MRLTWLFFLCAASATSAWSQSVTFESISTDQGLSHRTVYDILQDRHGFIWFATADGLNRYDGHRFVVYRHDPYDPHSLSESVVTCLLEDRAGRLWIGTGDGGLNRFDPATESFTAFRKDDARPGAISSDGIRALYEDGAGHLWIGTGGGGLNRLDPETGTFVHYKHDATDPHSLADDVVSAVAEDEAGTLWVGTANGLSKLDTSTGRFEHYAHPGDPRGRGHAYRLHASSGDGLWVGWHSGGLDHFDPETGAMTHFGHGPDAPSDGAHITTVRSLTMDASGNIWFGTYGFGVRRLDPRTGDIEAYTHDADDARSLSHDLVLTIFEDRSGVLWMGTWAGGVSKAAPALVWIHRYVLPKNAEGDPPHLSQLADDPSGDLWAATWEDGLLRLDRATGKHRFYRHDPADPGSIGDDGVISMAADPEGRLWLGMWVDSGVDRFNPETGRFTHYRHDPKDRHSISDDSVSVVFVDRPGRVWIGTRRGNLNRYDPDTDGFIRYPVQPAEASPNGTNFYVTALADDEDGNLWVGTAGQGLVRFDPSAGSFSRPYKHLPDDPTSLPSDAVGSLLVDTSNRLWIGTAGNGLSRFDAEMNAFQHFGDGLNNMFIHDLLEDDAGRIWMSTNHGISSFDPANGRFENYELDPSLRPVNVQHAALRKESGALIFGAAEAMFAFNPDRRVSNTYVPPLAISSMERTHADSLSSRPLVDHAAHLKDRVDLSYKHFIITFELASLSFYHHTQNRYAYRLDGFSDRWIELGKQRRFSFTGLPPGSYVLRARGSNNEGVWSEESRLELRIIPPWWRAWWAYALYGLAAVGLLVGARRYEMHRILLKNRLEVEHLDAERLRELDREKSRFFANISHEFRTPLTLILGPLEDIQDGFHGPVAPRIARQLVTVLSNGRRLLLLVGQLLDASRFDAGKIKLQAEETDLTDFVERFMEAFRPLAERKQVSFRFNGPGRPLPVYVDREQFEKVLVNLLGNAFKFTPEHGSIDVALDAGSEVILRVHDTGPGIKPEHLPRLFERFYQADASSTRRAHGTGIGLALVKSIVELHHGMVDVQSRVGEGTTFTVRLPLGREHFTDEEVIPPGENERVPDATLTAAVVDDAAPEGPEAAADWIHDANDTTVLIVDDNADIRSYVRRHLAPRYRVLEATDGREALGMIREHLPDLVVSDVMMPEMDGRELCRAVKKDAELDFIPIILLTAKASTESKIGGLKEGADDYLTKPFSVAELEVRVENLIASRQRLKARAYGESALPSSVAIHDDAAFVKRVRAEIEARLSDDAFDVDALTTAMGLGRTTLYRRLGDTLGEAPMTLIWRLRLERAAMLLRAGRGNVSEVAYGAGFKSVAHFCNRFKDEYGMTPATYAEHSSSRVE